ncbi:MAG TPA: ribosome maturation factor RimP [Thiotrichaceae bacterium]|jgi:ribosome maturation factor RimP|nr:ribosome maturation factor RimP [Thiotrichaceae bacterium]HIM08731.1 ribosome maturation factor RimP [Gammaproteobacteria bacterium]
MYRQNQHLIDLFENEVAALGYELLGIEVHQSTHGSILRVYIDKEGGIVVEDCVAVSRQLSGVLEVEDPIKGNYDLEVSSPGMDRPLFTVEQFKKVIGETIKLRLYEKYNNRKRFSGVLKAVDDEDVVIDCDNEEYKVPFRLIERARLVPQF